MTAGWRLVVAGGDATGDRGPRAAAIRKNVRCHARVRPLLPLLHFSGPAPGSVAGAEVPVKGMGVGAEGRWSPTAGRQWRWRRGGAVGPGAGVMAGRQGQAALEDQGRKRSVCDWCPVVRIRAPGEDTPKMVNILVGLYSSLIRLLLPPEPGYQVCLHEPI
jgi:hypothetical protein